MPHSGAVAFGFATRTKSMLLIIMVADQNDAVVGKGVSMNHQIVFTCACSKTCSLALLHIDLFEILRSKTVV